MRRAVPALVTLAIGLAAGLVVANNLADPRTGLRFTREVMGMTTVHPNTRLKVRAVRNDLIVHLAFWSLVGAQILAAVLCLAGSLSLWLARGQGLARAGLTWAFLVWFVGWRVIGAQWFASWQSERYNGLRDAFQFWATALLGLLLVYDE